MSAIKYGVIFLILLTSCKSEVKETEGTDGRTYFSVATYIQDQWDANRGQGYGMVKKVYFNGKVDSVFTNAIDLDWAPILKVFFDTDISDPKYIGQYDFSAFDDTLTRSRNFYYEAKDKKLYTRRLHITSNFFTDKITSIYIEAQKNSRVGTKNLKLLYTPLETISIQEWETSKTGEQKELRVVYEFL